MNFFFETKRTGWHESEDFLPFDFVDLSNSLSRSIHFRIIYYISLHSLLKEKETNRPLARFDSNKTSTTRTRKTETFVRSKKVRAFHLSRLHLNAKDNFSLELLHGINWLSV